MLLNHPVLDFFIESFLKCNRNNTLNRHLTNNIDFTKVIKT